MIGKRGIKTPPTIAEFKKETQRLTKHAFLLAPAALVVGIMFEVLGSRAMTTVFLALTIFALLSAAWINILMISLRHLERRSENE
ncbi:hypothetical protein [Agrobacterium sp. NPDC089420]|uniref:hypothetical protein n=1 Tax=Agrobacterium sp. NPDC089420 TaxID=3363918 RepID=UPI00384A5F0C